MSRKIDIDWKIVQGYYLLGGGQEQFSYEFKIHRGHPDFAVIENDSVCWTFYQAEDILTPIPAIIRVNRIYSEQRAIQLKLRKESDQGYPILPIIKVIEEFDMELLGYMFAAHSRFQNELNSLGGVSVSKYTSTLPEEKFSLYHDIHRKFKEGESISAIARDKGISRETVRRYLQMNVHEFLEFLSGSALEKYRNEILEYLYDDNTLSAHKLYDTLKQHHPNEFNISRRQFERYIKYLRKEYKISRN